MKSISLNCLALLLLFTTFQQSPAQIISGLSNSPNPTHPLTTLVSEDVVAIAAIDIAEIHLARTLEMIAELNLVSAEDLPKIKANLAGELDHLRRLQANGIQKIYCLMRPDDVSAQASCFAIPYGGNDREATAEMFEGYLERRFQIRNLKHHFEPGTILISQSKQHIETLINGPPRKNIANVNSTLRRIDGQPFCLAVLGNRDTRRVLRELVPEFEGSLGSFSGKLLADRVDRILVSLSLKGQPGLTIHVDTDSAETASSVKALASAGLQLLCQNTEFKKRLPTDFANTLLPFFEPTVDGNQVAISTDKLMVEPAQAKKFVAVVFNAGRKQLSDSSRNKNLRKIALGILNYESAHNHFPRRVSKSKDGKPLLSWRVAILPFLGENQLYKKFKLDEPWNSEHNLPLAQQMPNVYWDAGSGSTNNRDGRTVYQIPVGAGTILDGNEDVDFGDLTDGSSNTILAVATTPEKAIVWTQPTDWEVDFKKPLEGLFDEKQKSTYMVRADGSVQQFNNRTDVKNLIRLLKRADGEIVKSP